MKQNIVKYGAFFLFPLFLFTSCGKTYMEENQDKYKPTDVIPVVIGASGPTLVLQTKSYQYQVTYTRAGSTWTWTAVNATVSSVSNDKRTATVTFTVLPANDTALIKVTETTAAGVTSPEKVIKVKVKPYCPLTNGMADLIGSWSGTDAYDYESIITTQANNSTSVKMKDISVPFIEDWWGEEVIEGGTCVVTVNDDGTITIPRQYIYTTLYDGDEYRYEIIGSGTWDNCGTSPSMSIKYDIYYEGASKGIAATYSSYLPNPYLLAEIELDEGIKSSIKEIKSLNKGLRKPVR